MNQGQNNSGETQWKTRWRSGKGDREKGILTFPPRCTFLREGLKGSVQLVHKLPSRALRIHAMGFLRVFCASRVPVTVFGEDESERYNAELPRFLICFAEFKHMIGKKKTNRGNSDAPEGMDGARKGKSSTNLRNRPDSYESSPCNLCAKDTLRAALQCNNSAPSASNLAMELCRIAPTSPTYADWSPLAAFKAARILALGSASVIGKAIEGKQGCSERK